MTKAKTKKRNAKRAKKKSVEIKKKASPKKIFFLAILGLVVIAAGVYLFFLPKKPSFSPRRIANTLWDGVLETGSSQSK